MLTLITLAKAANININNINAVANTSLHYLL